MLIGIVPCCLPKFCCSLWYCDSRLLYVFYYLTQTSAESIAHTVGFNGGPIYGSQNTFGLSTNTIVLFAFVLAVAVVLSYAYMWAARAFTKQFIWITGR